MTEIITIAAANIGAVTAVLVTAWKAYRTTRGEWQRMVDTLEKHGVTLSRIESEVSVNSGKSVKDAVLRIDAAVAMLTELQQACVENCGTASVMLDENGQVIRASSAYTALTGLTTSEAQDWGWRQSVHPDDLDEVLRDWSEALREKRLFHRRYRVVNVKTGQETICNVTARPVFAPGHGRLVGWICWLRPHNRLEVRT